MKKQSTSKLLPSTLPVKVGVFSKRDAALEILAGTKHLHSTVLGAKDPLVLHNQKILTAGETQPFSWQREVIGITQLRNSDQRQKDVDSVLASLGTDRQRELGEKVATVLEELVTNAFFHAYETKGKPKYPRRAVAELSAKEAIRVTYGNQHGGVYLSVEDRGGNFKFDRFQQVFERCYKSTQNPIESKEGGAGLGLYMVYEIVTHLRVDVLPKHHTNVQVWISDPKQHDGGRFSFNFFSWRQEE